MHNVKRQVLNNSESANKVNLIIILLSITMFLIIGVASIGFSLSNNTTSHDLKDFIQGVTITDAEKNPIDDGTLYVGEKYHIQLQFQEKGAQGIQFGPDDSSQLTYQIPKAFKVEPVKDVNLKVSINGHDVDIGTYSIDEDGMLTIQLNEEGKQALNSSTDVSLTFDITVTAQPNPDADDGKIHFGDAEGTIDFNLTNDAKIEVEKTGIYTEDEGKDPKGGTLSYTVKATVEHGEVHNPTIKDTLKPPHNPNFDIKFKNGDGNSSVKVVVKREVEGEIKEFQLSNEDYELVFEQSDADDQYHDQTFELKLKDKSEYNPLKDGDVIEVTYDYRVDYKSGGELYGDTVTNDVKVKGTSKFTDPNTQEEKENQVEEHKKNETNVFRSPIGGGKVVKDQEYDANAKKLHYTVYAIVPKGNWNPFFLRDGINVTLNGKTYKLHEFKKDGRIKDIEVSAMYLDEGQKEIADNTYGHNLVLTLQQYKDKAKKLTGYNYDNLEGYDPNSTDQFVYKLEDTVAHIIFSLQEDERNDGHWGKWGHYNSEKDCLIILEYDLDLSEGNIDLQEDNGQEIIQKPVKEVLDAGITNDINLRYDGYYTGYTIFYTDADKLSKTGKFDKNTNTIDYTVSLNTADDEVKKYLEKVQDNWNKDVGEAHQWNYEESMKAEFYDILPKGWEYVENSFEIVTIERGVETHWQFMKDTGRLVTKTEEIDGEQRTVLIVPIIYFRATDAQGHNRDMYSEVFGNPNITSFCFHYKLKASDEYLKEHASDDIKTMIHNEASIKDKDSTQWETETDVEYFPTRLFKEAKQEGQSNLIRFTLIANPNGVKLNKTNNKNFLLIIDNSAGMQIQMDTIKVLDENKKELTKVEDLTLNGELKDDEWGIVSYDEENSRNFKLKVPDGKALTITYDAYIEDMGDDIAVSNTASIEGLAESDTSYQGVLQVDDIYGSGDANAYELTFEKVDQDQTTKKLQGATFEFCIVLSDTSSLTSTNEYVINGQSYKCHREDSWTFTTNENGQYKIEKSANWNLEPDNYYIIKETEAPEGYILSEEPILFYYGMQNKMDKSKCSLYALPNGSLTIKNEPVPYKIPVTGGIGHKIYYIVGFLLIVLSFVFIFSRRIKLKN